MKFQAISIWTIILFIIMGCKPETQLVHDYMMNFPDIYKKRIIFPNELMLFNDIDVPDDFLLSGKRIICMGSMNCSPCIIRLKEIESYLEENPSVKIVYIANGNKSDYFEYQVQKNDFSFPVYHDLMGVFVLSNQLENYNKSVILINESDEVVLVGSPFDSKTIKKLYETIINE